MASVSQWEVVGKPKKSKTNSPSAKNAKKQVHPKMTTIEPNPPLKEDKTMFTAFLEKEEREQLKAAKSNAASASSRGVNVNTNNKKQTTQKKKKPEIESKKVEKIPLETAIAEIHHSELDDILSQSQMKFPDNPDVWLKDLASFLNLKLENVKETSPVYKGKSQGFPLEKLGQNSQKVLNSVVKKFSNQTLDNLFYHCVQQMLAAASKDQCSMGYKIFLQLLANHKPDITVSKTYQYLELLKTHQNRPALCITILWAVGQCGVKNFKAGVKVWLDLMLPMLDVRQVAHYPIEYLEQLISNQKNDKSKYSGVVALNDYLQVLDVTFNPGFNMSNDLRKRLTGLYFHVKALAHEDSPSQTLRTFFAPCLGRFTVGANAGMKKELLRCLVQCLTTDKQSFSIWCQLYTKHLVASGHLLEHICNEWNELAPKFDKKLLHETLRSFVVTNEEMETQGKGNRDGLALCQAATKDLVARLTRASFPWGLLVFLLFSVVASIVVYDVYSSPNIRRSRTMSFLEHYGILALLEQAWGRIHTFMTLADEWIRTNCPVYYAQVKETVGPFLVLVYTSLKDSLIKLEEVTRSHRAWLVEETFCLFHCLYDLSPETWTWLHHTSLLAWEATLDYSLELWKHSVHLAVHAEHWLKEHVLTGSMSTDNLKETAQWAMVHVQNFTTETWVGFMSMLR